MDIKDLKSGVKSDENSFYFKAKNELIEQFIKKLNKNNINILILGNGPSESLRTLNKYGKVYATDIDQQSLNLIPKNSFFKKIKANIMNLPLKNNFFDIIICCDVLEHVKKDKKAVNEIYRVLKKEGNVLCTVPAFQFLFSSHDISLGHIKRYSKKELLDLFKNFKLIKISFWNFFMFFPIAIKRLINKNKTPKIDELSIIPKKINNILYKILNFENNILNHLDFPIGLSLFIILKK